MDSKIDQIADFYQSQPKQEIMAGAPVNELRLVLIGKTGNGKSKTANTILQNISPFSCSETSCTTSFSLRNANRFGKQVCLVDTPGLFTNRDYNASMEMAKVRRQVQKEITSTIPGPHAIILTVPIGRFREESVEIVNHFVAYGKLERFDSKDKQSDYFDEWSVDGHELRLVKIRKSRADKSETRTTIFVEKLINPLEPINKNRFRHPFCVVIPDDGKIFDNRNDQKEMKYPICLQSHGRHAVVQSQPIGRFTEEDEETVKYSQSYLGENLVGMILLIVTFLATIRKKKVEVLSEDALLAGHISGPVRNTIAYPVGKKSHELAIDDFEDSNKTKLSINTKIILDSMIISGGMEKDPNHVCKPEQKKCQMCIDRNEASYWCNTCRRNICNFCKLYHEKVWMVKNHNVQALF